VEYWKDKIQRNKMRNRPANKELKQRSYLVVRIRECEIKKGRLPKKL
jgi:G:T-mismatch repair DNA endonuclease (very short patch repair protein)